MSKKPRKRRSKKGKIKLKSGAKVVRRDSVRNDAIPHIQGRPPASVAPVFRVKIRKKQ